MSPHESHSKAWAIQISFKGSRWGRGPGIKISELPHSQWDGGAREPRLGPRRPAGHRKRMLQQSFGAVRGSHRHRAMSTAPYWGWKLLAALVGARNAPASSSRR